MSVGSFGLRFGGYHMRHATSLCRRSGEARPLALLATLLAMLAGAGCGARKPPQATDDGGSRDDGGNVNDGPRDARPPLVEGGWPWGDGKGQAWPDGDRPSYYDSGKRIDDGPTSDGGFYLVDQEIWLDIPAPPPPPELTAHTVSFFYGFGPTAAGPYYHAWVHTKGGTPNYDNSYAGVELSPLAVQGLPRRIRDLRLVVQRTRVPDVKPAPLVIGDRWLWRYKQVPKIGTASAGLVTSVRTGHFDGGYGKAMCYNCPQLTDTLAVSPPGDYVAIPRDDGSAVLISLSVGVVPPTTELTFAGGQLHPASLALSDQALYAVTSGSQTTDLHTLWRLPFKPQIVTPPQAVALPLMSDQSTPRWVAGDEGLLAHRGLNSDVLVFSGARPAASDGTPPLAHEDLYATVGGKPALRLTQELGALGAGPELTAISPSGQRVAFVRRETNGWDEILVGQTQGGAPLPPLKTGQIFSGGKLLVDALVFIDDQHLLAVVGPAPSATTVDTRRIYAVDLSSGQWKDLLHGGSPPFDWSTLPHDRVDRVWVGPKAQRVLVWAGNPSKGELVVTIVDLASGATAQVSGLPPSSVVDPLRCGLQGQFALFRLWETAGAGAEGLYAVDFTQTGVPTMRLVTSVAGSGASIARLHCGANGAYAAFTATDPAKGPAPFVWVVDPHTLGTSSSAARVVAQETAEVGQLRFGQKSEWLYYVVGSQLKGVPTTGSAAPITLFQGYPRLIILGGTTTGV